MASLNKVFLIGNVTMDPELRYTPSGTAVTDINLAVNRKFHDSDGNTKEEVVFINVTFWAKSAEIICKYVHKGSPLMVEGRLSQESWEDKETGKKNTKTKVVAENFQLLGSKPE